MIDIRNYKKKNQLARRYGRKTGEVVCTTLLLSDCVDLS